MFTPPPPVYSVFSIQQEVMRQRVLEKKFFINFALLLKWIYSMTQKQNKHIF